MNKELRDMLLKYPDAKIYPCTHYDVVAGDWGYWIGGISKVYYGKIWFYDKRFYLDFSEMKEQIENIEELKYLDVLDKIKIEEGIIILIDCE